MAVLKKPFFLGGGGDFHVEIFKNTISVLGLTLRYLFKTLPKGSMFTLCSEKQKEIHTTMRNNSTGGTSILFHSFHEKDKTCVKGKEYKLVQSINWFDTNALYLHALMKPMPSDLTVICRVEEEFKAECQSLYTVQNRQWLKFYAG